MNNLRKYRLLNKLSQRDLAEKSNVSFGMIGMLETNKRKGTIDIWNKLANALGVEVDKLITRDSCNLCIDPVGIAVTHLMERLISNGLVKDSNDIDNSVARMILDTVKTEVDILDLNQHQHCGS